MAKRRKDAEGSRNIKYSPSLQRLEARKYFLTANRPKDRLKDIGKVVREARLRFAGAAMAHGPCAREDAMIPIGSVSPTRPLANISSRRASFQ